MTRGTGSPTKHAGNRPHGPQVVASIRRIRLVGAPLVAMALVGSLDIPTAVASDPGESVVASDSFQRRESNRWGRADTAQEWTHPLGSEGMAVAQGSGIIMLGDRAPMRDAVLRRPRLRDTSTAYSFAFNRLPSGGDLRVMASLRRFGGQAYLARVGIAKSGRLSLSVVRTRNGRNTRVGNSRTVLKGWRYRPGQWIRTRVMVVGAGPTQIRMKVWAAGTRQPKRWRLIANDERPGQLKTGGKVGLRAFLPQPAGQRSVRVRVKNVKVRDVHGARRLRVREGPVRTGRVTGPRGTYGPGLAMYSLANTAIRAGVNPGSMRFRAARSGTITAARVYVQTGSGYSAGTGGSYRFTIERDNGRGFPDGVPVGTSGTRRGLGQAAGYHFALTSPARITAGRLYHLVWTNVDASPASNYISANSLWVGKIRQDGRHHPRYPNRDLAFMYRHERSWVVREGYAPIFDLTFSNGRHQGMGYMEISYPDVPSRVGHIRASRGRLVRERIKVSGADRRVTGAGIRLQRSPGASDGLVVTLRGSAGGPIDSFVIPASSIPTGSMSGSDLGRSSRYVHGRFRSPRTLSAGTTYFLEFSTTGDGEYLTWPIRKGTSYGYSRATYFADGVAQYSTDGGKSWASLGRVPSENDLQFYLSTG